MTVRRQSHFFVFPSATKNNAAAAKKKRFGRFAKIILKSAVILGAACLIIYLHITMTISFKANKSEEHVIAKPHPHAGALDENGRPGYVHDSTFLKHKTLTFQLGQDSGPKAFNEICQTPVGEGEEGSAGYRGLQRIKVAVAEPTNQVKLFCMIYSHSGNHNMVRAVAQTWGQRCDGFLAASDKTDASIGAVNLLHEGPEEYGNMWQKVRSMWAYAHDNYLSQYDWFHIGGDDMFVVPENLRYYITQNRTSLGADEPVFMGGPIPGLSGRPRLVFCGGGSGYTLNRAALKLLVEDILPSCRADEVNPAEDVVISNCFLKAGVKCSDTSDPAYRYHAQDAEWQANWKWGERSRYNIMQPQQKQFHKMDPQEGIEGISTYSVSFHLKPVKRRGQKPEDISVTLRRLLRYYVIVYGLCPNMQ